MLLFRGIIKPGFIFISMSSSLYFSYNNNYNNVNSFNIIIITF